MKADFLERTARLALGAAPVIRPVVASRFAVGTGAAAMPELTVEITPDRDGGTPDPLQDPDADTRRLPPLRPERTRVESARDSRPTGVRPVPEPAVPSVSGRVVDVPDEDRVPTRPADVDHVEHPSTVQARHVRVQTTAAPAQTSRFVDAGAPPQSPASQAAVSQRAPVEDPRDPAVPVTTRVALHETTPLRRSDTAVAATPSEPEIAAAGSEVLTASATRPVAAMFTETRAWREQQTEIDAPDPPVVRITIGRVEVRAVVPAPAAPVAPTSDRRPKLSLDAYRSQRRRGPR